MKVDKVTLYNVGVVQFAVLCSKVAQQQISQSISQIAGYKAHFYVTVLCLHHDMPLHAFIVLAFRFMLSTYKEHDV